MDSSVNWSAHTEILCSKWEQRLLSDEVTASWWGKRCLNLINLFSRVIKYDILIRYGNLLVQCGTNVTHLARDHKYFIIWFRWMDDKSLNSPSSSVRLINVHGNVQQYIFSMFFFSTRPVCYPFIWHMLEIVCMCKPVYQYCILSPKPISL